MLTFTTDATSRVYFQVALSLSFRARPGAKVNEIAYERMDDTTTRFEKEA